MNQEGASPYLGVADFFGDAAALFGVAFFAAVVLLDFFFVGAFLAGAAG